MIEGSKSKQLYISSRLIGLQIFLPCTVHGSAKGKPTAEKSTNTDNLNSNLSSSKGKQSRNVPFSRIEREHDRNDLSILELVEKTHAQMLAIL